MLRFGLTKTTGTVSAGAAGRGSVLMSRGIRGWIPHSHSAPPFHSTTTTLQCMREFSTTPACWKGKAGTEAKAGPKAPMALEEAQCRDLFPTIPFRPWLLPGSGNDRGKQDMLGGGLAPNRRLPTQVADSLSDDVKLVVVVSGEGGSGKTYACLYASQILRERRNLHQVTMYLNAPPADELAVYRGKEAKDKEAHYLKVMTSFIQSRISKWDGEGNRGTHFLLILDDMGMQPDFVCGLCKVYSSIMEQLKDNLKVASVKIIVAGRGVDEVTRMCLPDKYRHCPAS